MEKKAGMHWMGEQAARPGVAVMLLGNGWGRGRGVVWWVRLWVCALCMSVSVCTGRRMYCMYVEDFVPTIHTVVRCSGFWMQW